jgi:predicted DNA-binding transcriptional regulator YafY
LASPPAPSVTSVGVLIALGGLLWTLVLALVPRRVIARSDASDADAAAAALLLAGDKRSVEGGLAGAEGQPGARVALATALPLLRQAIAHRRLARIAYTSAQASLPTERVIRPLRLESHGDIWYLHAYCTLAQAERLFRLDRISELALLDARTRARPAAKPGPRPRPAAAPVRVARVRAPVAAPRSGFFPAPPAAPPGSPLVRIWLEE